MFKDRLLNVLKCTQQAEKNGEEMLQATIKIEKQKRLSSQEFLKGYDALWKEGPSAKYQNPDSWTRQLPSATYGPKP